MTTKSSGVESQSSGDPIVSMTISGVMDNEQCPLCKYLDQVTIDINDPDAPLFMPPLHDGCRCVEVYMQRGMRPEFRTVNYHRPPREMIEKYLAPYRLARAKLSNLITTVTDESPGTA